MTENGNRELGADQPEVVHAAGLSRQAEVDPNETVMSARFGIACVVHAQVAPLVFMPFEAINPPPIAARSSLGRGLQFANWP